MRNFLVLTFFVTSLGFSACSNKSQKTDQEIESANQAKADSLLNAALADTSSTDSLTDSIK